MGKFRIYHHIILFLITIFTSVEGLANWENVPGTLKWISAGSADRVWGIGTTGAVFQWTGNGWSGKPGTLSQLSVGVDGTIWGVTSDNMIYRWNNDNWVSVEGGLKNIAVGSAEHIWGVGPTGWVFKWTGINWERQPDMPNNASDPAIQISASADGSVWGVTSANHIYQWTGSEWSRVSGGLKNVSTGAEKFVWGVGPTGSVYSNTPNGWEKKVGKLKQLTIAADGTKWGVTDVNKVYRWESNGIADADRMVSDLMLDRRWPNGIVPFEIDTSINSFSPIQVATLTEVIMDGPASQNPKLSALLSWEDATSGAVRFVPRNISHCGCNVKFRANSASTCGDSGTGSCEGNGTGGNRGIEGCNNQGIFWVTLRSNTTDPNYSFAAPPPGGPYGRQGQPNHELGHVLGFQHEMRRPDRNNHIQMYFGPPVDDERFEYDEVKQGHTILEWKYFIGNAEFPGYDVNSVMQYGELVKRGWKCNPLVGDDFPKCLDHDLGCVQNQACICNERLSKDECRQMGLMPAEMTSLSAPALPIKGSDSNNPSISDLDIVKTQLMYGVKGDWMANTDWCAADVQKIHIGDFNGDGWQDLLCHSTDSGRVWIDYADLSGRFNGTDANDNSQYCMGPSRQVLVADYNGDSKDDVLCHDRDTGQVAIDYANTQGHLTGQNWPTNGFFDLSICNNSISNLHVGDFDGDGRTDLLCHDVIYGGNKLAYANSSGRFTGIQWTTPDAGWCQQPELMVVGDFNGDGRSDALCHNPGEGHRKIDFEFSNNVINAMNWDSRNYGAGTFCIGADRSLHVADVNGDGRDDLLCHDPRIGSVSIDLANGDYGIGWEQGSGLWGSDLVYDLAFCNAHDGRLLLGAFNGQDSRADLLCHNKQTGHKAILIARSGGIYVIPPG